jgi:hypothetical protein
MGGAITAAIGAGLTAYGISQITSGEACTPMPCWALIAAGVVALGMAAMSFAQSDAHGDTAGQAAYTASRSNGSNGSAIGGPTGTAGTDSQVLNNPLLSDSDKAAYQNSLAALKDMERKGIYNPKNGTLKINGKEIKMSSFQSADSMAAAGIPKSAVDMAMAKAKSLESNFLAKAEKLGGGISGGVSGYEEGGGKGGGSKSASSADPYGAGGFGLAAGGKNGSDKTGREPTSFAGLQKNYNGDPIGVAGDSIFAMMNRRYKVKENQDSFLTAAEAAIQK